jgi:hypothetical protein
MASARQRPSGWWNGIWVDRHGIEHETRAFKTEDSARLHAQFAEEEAGVVRSDILFSEEVVLRVGQTIELQLDRIEGSAMRVTVRAVASPRRAGD